MSSLRGKIFRLQFFGMMITIIAVLWFTAYHRAQGHWEEAQWLEGKGEDNRAAQHYQWAARSYYPMSEYGEKSLYRLWSLSEKYQMKGETQPALYYLDLMRGAVWSTRWLLTPYENWSDQVNHKIARLRGNGATMETDRVLGDRDRSMLAQRQALIDDLRPSVSQSLAILLSVIAICISMRQVFSMGLTKSLDFTPYTQQSIVYLSISIVSFFIALAL